MMAEGTRNTGRGRKKPVEMLPDMGRLQPQARELEEAVLGALMLEKDAYSIVSRSVSMRKRMRRFMPLS